jgi:hypothetical protein
VSRILDVFVLCAGFSQSACATEITKDVSATGDTMFTKECFVFLVPFVATDRVTLWLQPEATSMTCP